MTGPAFTIILPHRRNPGNDRAYAVALDCLMANTVNDFALLTFAAADHNLYATINRMVEQAPTECCVFTNSDMFMAPGWDVPMLATYDEHTFVTNVLVEPGAIGVYSENLTEDFGRKPETFRRADFEAWTGSAPVPDGEGWYAPYMFPRTGWLEAGGMDLSLDDGHEWLALDIVLFNRWKAAGNRIVRARSYAYHLQRYSDPAEQMHEKRDR